MLVTVHGAVPQPKTEEGRSPHAMTKHLLAAGFLGSLLALVGCDRPATAPKMTYTISGALTGGSDLSDVAIALTPGGVTVSPSPDGTYHFVGLTAGTYTVSPSLSGHPSSPPSRSITVGESSGNSSAVDFAMAVSAPANTPAIPVPSSTTDVLPATSATLVTDVAPVVNFSPAVDTTVPETPEASAPSSACPSSTTGNMLLVKSGKQVQPIFEGSYRCNHYNCHCEIFGDCDQCWNTCDATCIGPFVASSPYLRRTVYWAKVFQAVVDPGTTHAEADVLTTGASPQSAQALETTLAVASATQGNVADTLNEALTSTFTEANTLTTSVSIAEAQQFTQIFACTESPNQAEVFAVWQLHEQFDFSDKTGTVAWSDPIYHPTSEASLPVLDNATSTYFQSTTAF